MEIIVDCLNSLGIYTITIPILDKCKKILSEGTNKLYTLVTLKSIFTLDDLLEIRNELKIDNRSKFLAYLVFLEYIFQVNKISRSFIELEIHVIIGGILRGIYPNIL